MAVESIINLGIKGVDLVTSLIAKLNKNKKDLTKKSDVNLSGKVVTAGFGTKRVNQATGQVQRTSQEAAEKIRERIAKETEKEKEKGQPSEYGKNLKSELAANKAQAANSVLSFDGIKTAQAVIGAATAFIPVVDGVGKAINFMIDAAVSFKNKIKSQVAIVADTQAKNNEITNSYVKNSKETLLSGSTLKEEKYNVKEEIKGRNGRTGKFREVEKTRMVVDKAGRDDISKAEKAGIMSGLSASMGKLSDSFVKEANKLFVSDDGKKKYDIGQSTELAKGNFNALGTDKGFFMNQISSQFGNLPPSMRQKLTSQMFSMIKPEERDEQNDYGIRTANTKFDEMNRTSAANGLNAGAGANNNIALAEKVQRVEDKLSNMMQGGVSTIINKVDKIASAKDPKAAIASEFNDMKDAIKKGAIESMNAVSNGFKQTLTETGEAFKSTMNEVGSSIKDALIPNFMK